MHHRERRVRDGIVFSAVYPDLRAGTYPDLRAGTYPDLRAGTYPDLRAGTYPVRRDQTTPAGEVAVLGGTVAEFSWPDQPEGGF